MGEALRLIKSGNVSERENIGEKIKFLRKLKGDTRKEVCERIRLGEKKRADDIFLLEKIEEGEAELSKEQAQALAKYFDVKLSSLYSKSLKSEIDNWGTFNNNARKLYLEKSKSKGETLQELASNLGLSVGRVASLFSHKKVYNKLSSEEIEKLLRYYDVSIGYFNEEREIDYFQMRAYSDKEGGLDLIEKYQEGNSNIEDWDVFNNNARKLFLAVDKTLHELSKEMDVPLSIVGNLFSTEGHVEKLPPVLVNKLCGYFEVDIDFFKQEREINYFDRPKTEASRQEEIDSVVFTGELDGGSVETEELGGESIEFEDFDDDKEKIKEYEKLMEKYKKEIALLKEKYRKAKAKDKPELTFTGIATEEESAEKKGFLGKIKDFFS